MRKMIQIRNVPLSDYLLHEIRKTAERPTVEELMERIRRRSASRLSQSPAEVLRSERDRR